jgi:hypothetical protein
MSPSRPRSGSFSHVNDMITKAFFTAKTFRAHSTNFFRQDKSLRADVSLLERVPAGKTGIVPISGKLYDRCPTARRRRRARPEGR